MGSKQQQWSITNRATEVSIGWREIEKFFLLVENKTTCCIIMTNTRNTASFISALMDIFAQVDSLFSLLDNYEKGNLMQNQVQNSSRLISLISCR